MLLSLGYTQRDRSRCTKWRRTASESRRCPAGWRIARTFQHEGFPSPEASFHRGLTGSRNPINHTFHTLRSRQVID